MWNWKLYLLIVVILALAVGNIMSFVMIKNLKPYEFTEFQANNVVVKELPSKSFALISGFTTGRPYFAWKDANGAIHYSSPWSGTNAEVKSAYYDDIYPPA